MKLAKKFLFLGWLAFLFCQGQMGKADVSSTTTETIPVTSSPVPEKTEENTSSQSLPIVLPPVNNEAFKVGEELIFSLDYEFITAGQASLKIEQSLTMDGRPTIAYISTAKTNDFFDNFFKVRDYNATQVDEASLHTVNFHQNLREGGYRVIRNKSFDYKKGTFKFEKHRKGNYSQQEGVIREPVLDVLAAFYYTRILPLEPGMKYFMKVFSDEKEIYPLRVEVAKELEKIRVPAGEFVCVKITPYIVGDAIFKAREGKMSIWLTNDARHMPVLLSSKVFIGSFDAQLVEYKPPLK